MLQGMLQGWYRGGYRAVTEVLKEGYMCVTRVLDAYYRGVTGLWQGCYNRGLTGILHRCTLTLLQKYSREMIISQENLSSKFYMFSVDGLFDECPWHRWQVLQKANSQMDFTCHSLLQVLRSNLSGPSWVYSAGKNDGIIGFLCKCLGHTIILV